MKSWKIFLDELEKELGLETVSRWLKPLEIVKFDAANLYLAAQDSFQIDWFEEHIRPRIQKKLLNNNYRPIAVHLSGPKNSSFKEAPRSSSFSIQSDLIDPELSLENFLFSPENQVARQLILDIEKKMFNPIFFYGPKGSGKTHLLTSAALLLQKKGLKVFFVRADRFTEHVVTAIRLQKMEEFRKVYREIDALVIDNLEDLKGKAATQEEFFHTFNALHTTGKYLLLSANGAPSQLSDIESRLISRFEWGISIRLQKTDPGDILVRKAALWRWNLSEELKNWLLSTFPSDPLIAFHTLAVRSKSRSISIDAAPLLLKDLMEREKKIALTPEKIIKAVATHYGIRVDDLLGKSQTRDIVAPRKIAMYLCREKLKLPFQKIGEIFNRDHSTVMTSIEQVAKQDLTAFEQLKF